MVYDRFLPLNFGIRVNCLRRMKRKAQEAQEPGHIQKYVEVTRAAQRSDLHAQAINQRFPNLISSIANNFSRVAHGD